MAGKPNGKTDMSLVATPAPEPLVAIDGLRVEFDTDEGPVVGVENVGFSIMPGETVCVVGESGSGKSVTSLSIMRLVEFGGGRSAAAASASRAKAAM
jgi:peptide/nickel transport system ATP-binding protein/glutathione transport system ATP-binding protein